MSIKSQSAIQQRLPDVWLYPFEYFLLLANTTKENLPKGDIPLVLDVQFPVKKVTATFTSNEIVNTYNIIKAKNILYRMSFYQICIKIEVATQLWFSKTYYLY